MKTFISAFLLLFIASSLGGCVVARIKDNPMNKVALPPLAKDKGRVFFQHRGLFVEHAEIIDAKTEKVISPLRHRECTYVDFKPGNYVFRPGVLSPMGSTFDTEITIKAGKEYYLLWFWQKRLRYLSAFSNDERGSHFMRLHPDQGKEMLNHCNYRETVKLNTALNK